MSPVTDFDEAYAGSRDRLLLQLYAYCGDAAAADAALTAAYLAAGRRWHRLGPQESADRWVRDRAVRRLDGGHRAAAASGAGPPAGGAPAAKVPATSAAAASPSASNARLLAALAALDPVTRRLLIVRRLDDSDLVTAAQEVGIAEGAAEQALARASSALHGRGVDATPAGLQAALERLSDDLSGLPAVSAESLRQAGARRRLVTLTVASIVVVALVIGAGLVARAAWRPDAAGSGQSPTRTSPPVSVPGPTSSSPAATTPPPLVLDDGYLLTGSQVAGVHPGAGWQVVPTASLPPLGSVYGDCVEAADNPPPNMTWTRDFTAGSAPRRSRLRQVLQLAPSDTEATRSYRQVLAAFALCPGHQLVHYSRVTALGERAHLVQLVEPRAAVAGGTPGIGVEDVLVAQSGPVVTVFAMTAPDGAAAALVPAQLARLAGTAVDQVCSASVSACAAPPYHISDLRPPTDATAEGYLSVVDLPLVPHVEQPWVATDPADAVGNPSATACDRADLAGARATRVRTRSFVILQAPGVPTRFGLTETAGTFASRSRAQAFVSDVARAVGGCHRRQATLSVPVTEAVGAAGVSGWVWQVRQRVSKVAVVTFRVALVRAGDRVAEVTLTPTGGYDVSPAAFAALARRAAVRLGE